MQADYVARTSRSLPPCHGLIARLRWLWQGLRLTYPILSALPMRMESIVLVFLSLVSPERTGSGMRNP